MKPLIWTAIIRSTSHFPSNKCIGDDTKGAVRCRTNCIRKTKDTLCGTTVSISLPKFSEKLLPRKISLKSGNRLPSYDHNRFLIWRPSAILNLKKKSYLVIYLSSSSKSAYVCQISSISDDFSFKYGDFTICNMAAIRHLEFSKFCAFLTWPLSPCYSASLCKISLKPDNRLLSYGKKTIFKIRLSAILNFMLSFLSRVSIWRAILI